MVSSWKKKIKVLGYFAYFGPLFQKLTFRNDSSELLNNLALNLFGGGVLAALANFLEKYIASGDKMVPFYHYLPIC